MTGSLNIDSPAFAHFRPTRLLFVVVAFLLAVGCGPVVGPDGPGTQDPNPDPGEPGARDPGEPSHADEVDVSALLQSLEDGSPHELFDAASKRLADELDDTQIAYLNSVDWSVQQPEAVLQDPVLLEAARLLAPLSDNYDLKLDENSTARQPLCDSEECQALKAAAGPVLAVLASTAVCAVGITSSAVTFGMSLSGCGIILAAWIADEAHGSELEPGDYADPAIWQQFQGIDVQLVGLWHLHTIAISESGYIDENGNEVVTERTESRNITEISFPFGAANPGRVTRHFDEESGWQAASPPIPLTQSYDAESRTLSLHGDGATMPFRFDPANPRRLRSTEGDSDVSLVKK